MEKIKIDSKFADKHGEIMIVELGGHVDQSNSFQLQKMFDDIIDSGVFKVIVNFHGLHYMSSAGWGIFVGEVKRFREKGGDIKLAAMTPEINDVYQMLEFYHILDDYTSVEAAAKAFEKSSEMLDVTSDEDEETSTNVVVDVNDGADEDKEEIELNDDQAGSDDDSSASPPRRDHAEVIEMIPSSSQTPAGRKSHRDFIPHTLTQDVKLADLPVAEKVKKVISENPLVGLWDIKRILKHEHFGHTRIGVLKLWRLLKDLDLDNREKRYRYYRSC